MVGYDVDDAEAVDGLQVICQVGKLHMKAIFPDIALWCHVRRRLSVIVQMISDVEKRAYGRRITCNVSPRAILLVLLAGWSSANNAGL